QRAALAQSVEHFTRNEKVASSILAGGSIFICAGFFLNIKLSFNRSRPYGLDEGRNETLLIATVAAEILFWACLILGGVLRYIVKAPRIGLAFFIATPIIDIV